MGPNKDYHFAIYLKLVIQGKLGKPKPVRDDDWIVPEPKCSPRKASLYLGFTHEKYTHREPTYEIGTKSVKSLVQAKAWADEMYIPAMNKALCQFFYSTFDLSTSKRGTLYEKYDKELGWHPWMFAFEPFHMTDLPGGGLYRSTDKDGRVSLIDSTSYGVSSRSWPSRWDRIARQGERPWGGKDKPLEDDYGPL